MFLQIPQSYFSTFAEEDVLFFATLIARFLIPPLPSSELLNNRIIRGVIFVLLFTFFFNIFYTYINGGGVLAILLKGRFSIYAIIYFLLIIDIFRHITVTTYLEYLFILTIVNAFLSLTYAYDSITGIDLYLIGEYYSRVTYMGREVIRNFSTAPPFIGIAMIFSVLYLTHTKNTLYLILLAINSLSLVFLFTRSTLLINCFLAACVVVFYSYFHQQRKSFKIINAILVSSLIGFAIYIFTMIFPDFIEYFGYRFDEVQAAQSVYDVHNVGARMTSVLDVLTSLDGIQLFLGKGMLDDYKSALTWITGSTSWMGDIGVVGVLYQKGVVGVFIILMLQSFGLYLSYLTLKRHAGDSLLVAIIVCATNLGAVIATCAGQTSPNDIGIYAGLGLSIITYDNLWKGTTAQIE